MATYRDLISGSLRLLGVIAQGEAPSAAEADDALATLNEMIDSWNSTDALLYTTTTKIYTPSVAQSSYSIGPTGDIVVAVRPTRLYAAFLRNTSASPYYDIPMTILSDTEYASITAKGLTSNIPFYIYMDREWPNANLFVYPVPSGAGIALGLQYLEALDSGVGLDDTESLPPAYRQALRFNLAVKLAPEYGQEAPPTVQKTAITSLMTIKQGNQQPYRMDFDSNSNAMYNIATDSIRRF